MDILGNGASIIECPLAIGSKVFQSWRRFEMRHLVAEVIFVPLVFLINQTVWPIEIGDISPKVEIKGELGGRLDGTSWSSEELRERSMSFFTWTRMKEIRTMMPAKLWTKRICLTISFNRLRSLTWRPPGCPIFGISFSGLKDKQKRYPETIYVRDNKKVLVNV